jgi:phospholipase/carboxylesterase
MPTRREAIATIGAGLASLAGCSGGAPTQPVEEAVADGPGRITVRPRTPTEPAPIGQHEMPLTTGVVGLTFFPTTYSHARPAPVALLFHGIAHGPDELMTPLRPIAERIGMVLVAIGSASLTWDLVQSRGLFGVDVPRVNRALDWLFDRCRVDTARLSLAGFSDGASYAVAMGRVNGDLFNRVIAYSPAAYYLTGAAGKPEFYVTHGSLDDVASVDTTRVTTVPNLRALGYSVEYHEFVGGHGVPQGLLDASMTWAAR